MARNKERDVILGHVEEAIQAEKARQSRRVFADWTEFPLTLARSCIGTVVVPSVPTSPKQASSPRERAHILNLNQPDSAIFHKSESSRPGLSAATRRSANDLPRAARTKQCFGRETSHRRRSARAALNWCTARTRWGLGHHRAFCFAAHPGLVVLPRVQGARRVEQEDRRARSVPKTIRP